MHFYFLQGYSINITAQIELQIFGRINTNAVSQNVHHDVDGSTAGWGGSYGGSGGRPACDTYFSNTVDQVLSIAIFMFIGSLSIICCLMILLS